MQEGGARRRATVEQAIQSVGGRLEAFYFAFGDVYVIADLPDNAAAAALSLTISASGVVSTTVTVLLTVEEADRAVKLSPQYRAPGQ